MKPTLTIRPKNLRSKRQLAAAQRNRDDAAIARDAEAAAEAMEPDLPPPSWRWTAMHTLELLPAGRLVMVRVDGVPSGPPLTPEEVAKLARKLCQP